jgi:uncharacterized protein YdaU (DUF1376 family)
MTDTPAMLLWTDSYLGDTSHLTTVEHGAYLLLLMAMWRAGGALPNDETRLARTARLNLDKWRKIAPTIMDFMTVTGTSVTQKRLKLEFEIQLSRREKLERAGKAGGRAKALKNIGPAPSIATPTPVAQVKHHPSLPEPEPEPEKKEEGNLTVSCPKQVRTRVGYSDEFEAFWRAYPTDAGMAKKEAFTAWQRLAPEDRSAALKAIPAWKAHCATIRDYRMLHACRYLSQRRFEGLLEVTERVGTQVFVKIGSASWRAWEQWNLAEHGKKQPVNKEGTGWWFTSEWPPSNRIAAE